MSETVRWVFHHPLPVVIPVLAAAYLVIGAAVGIALKWRFARHRWIKHHTDVQKGYLKNECCWCEHPVYGFIRFGYGSAPILWPLVVAVWILVLVAGVVTRIVAVPVRIYRRILGLISPPADSQVNPPKEDAVIFPDLEDQIIRLLDRIRVLETVNQDLASQIGESKASAALPKEEKIDGLLRKSEEVLREMDERDLKEDKS